MIDWKYVSTANANWLMNTDMTNCYVIFSPLGWMLCLYSLGDCPKCFVQYLLKYEGELKFIISEIWVSDRRSSSRWFLMIGTV